MNFTSISGRSFDNELDYLRDENMFLKGQLSGLSIKNKVFDIQQEKKVSTLNLFEIEKKTIMDALIKNYRKRKQTAETLGISDRTLYRKMKEYDITNQALYEYTKQ